MNKFAHVPFNFDQHWELITGWYAERKFPHPDPRFLPPTGFVVEFEGKPVICAFLFKTDANACIMGHLVGDPKSDKVVRDDCMDYLMALFRMIAEQDGYGMLCCSTNIPKLMLKFESFGFTKTDENVSAFGRLLCP